MLLLVIPVTMVAVVALVIHKFVKVVVIVLFI